MPHMVSVFMAVQKTIRAVPQMSLEPPISAARRDARATRFMGADGERFPRKIRALNPRTVAADVRRRNLVIRRALRLLTSAATNERFMGRRRVLSPLSPLVPHAVGKEKLVLRQFESNPLDQPPTIPPITIGPEINCALWRSELAPEAHPASGTWQLLNS